MATQPWKYLINTFYVQTVDTIKNALSLSTDHLAKLTANEADADILALKTVYLPLHNAFVVSYNQLHSKLGIYKGKTQTFEEMVDEMRYTKLNEWRGQVFAVFPEGTPNATAIFPQGKKPFYEGTYEQRVEAVDTLSTTLATFTGNPTLITLGTAVGAYHTTLLGARALQQTDEGSTETLRTNLKANHETLCVALYRNLGSLMAKYAESPETVTDFFDLTLLRNTGGDTLTSIVIEGDALTGTINDIVTSGFTITPSTTIQIIVSGNELLFSAAPAAGPTTGPTVWHIFPGTENKTYVAFAALVGISEINTFLKVQCIGPLAGHYKITFNNVIEVENP